MSSLISFGEQYLSVANLRLAHLVELAVEVGAARANGDEQRRWVGELRQFSEAWWPGVDLDLAQQCPSVEARKFWTVVFYDVARRIFLRELGDTTSTGWQSVTIGNAYVVARILSQAIREADPTWSPRTEDAQELEVSRRDRLRL